MSREALPEKPSPHMATPQDAGRMTTVVRVGVGVLWVVGMVLLTTWSYTDAAVTVGLLSTVLAAALIGSWWVLVVPLPPALVLLAGSLATANESDGHGTGLQWAVVITAVTALIVSLLALGVGVNRLVLHAWKRHRAQQ